MSVPQTILELVERFERNKDAYRSPHYNGTQLRREFLHGMSAAGLATAGAVFTLGRWGHDRLREWSSLHTGRGGDGGSGEVGGSPVRPGGGPPGPVAGADAGRVRAGAGPRGAAIAPVAPARTRAPAAPSQGAFNWPASDGTTTPPSRPVPPRD